MSNPTPSIATRLAVPQSVRSARFYRRWQAKLQRRTVRRRVIRYGLLAANLIILVGVVLFIVQNPQSATKKPVAASQSTQPAVASPLDQLASANIAVTVAQVTNLPETNSVTNVAESENIDLALSAIGSQSVIAKPQVVSTALKSKADIVHYTSVAGDTVSGLATKFGVTSNSIRWSNTLGAGDSIATGTKLVIPPVNGIAYTVKQGDTVASLASKFGAQQDQIVLANDTEIAGLQVGELILIPNGQVAAPVARTASFGRFSFGSAAIYGFNGYDPGWCTWYVANRRAQLGNPVPSNLGNAYSWYKAAVLAGLPTGTVPRAGAVMVNQAGDHVAVVEVVNDDGSFWISEMNSHGQVSMTNPTPTGGLFRVDWKVIPSVGSLKFIY